MQWPNHWNYTPVTNTGKSITSSNLCHTKWLKEFISSVLTHLNVQHTFAILVLCNKLQESMMLHWSMDSIFMKSVQFLLAVWYYYYADHECAPMKNREKKISRVYLNTARYLKVDRYTWVDQSFSHAVVSGVYHFMYLLHIMQSIRMMGCENPPTSAKGIQIMTFWTAVHKEISPS